MLFSNPQLAFSAVAGGLAILLIARYAMSKVPSIGGSSTPAAVPPVRPIEKREESANMRLQCHTSLESFLSTMQRIGIVDSDLQQFRETASLLIAKAGVKQ